MNTKLKDYYQILEITPDATSDEIKKAYRRMARLYHPDACSQPNAHEIFLDISEAYEILKDETSRYNYDALYSRKNNPHQSHEKESSYNRQWEDFKQREERAQKTASEYAAMSLSYLLENVIDLTLKAGKTILVGETRKSRLDFGDYVSMGFKGLILTICIIISLTGIGSVPGVLISYLVLRSVVKNNTFVGILPFIISTLVADGIALFLLYQFISSLFR